MKVLKIGDHSLGEVSVNEEGSRVGRRQKPPSEDVGAARESGTRKENGTWRLRGWLIAGVEISIPRKAAPHPTGRSDPGLRVNSPLRSTTSG